MIGALILTQTLRDTQLPPLVALSAVAVGVVVALLLFKFWK